jgi:hypothetical protein
VTSDNNCRRAVDLTGTAESDTRRAKTRIINNERRHIHEECATDPSRRVSSTVDTTTAGSMTVVSPSPTATMQRSPVSGRGGPAAAAPPLQPAPAEPRKKGIMLLIEEVNRTGVDQVTSVTTNTPY